MPSFRASLGIVDARPGVPPEAVLDTARAALAAVRQVEDAFVDVEPLLRGDGIPRVVVRFLEPTGNDAEEDARAWQAAMVMAAGVEAVAETVGLRVYRRAGGRWLPLTDPGLGR
ncbi:MAG: hypothetical protein VB080_13870 [Propionicimonas sp.]|uniref:hypothetical protein n=1 Tax=Propionicimonas sp. TaxID=1955623 RepID=UPI002B1FC078|nr:hypothetical protein [Propionicimonas sp.]MEA4945510.1 hypothetical protein [Propionicimonas sp.]MEA5119496.1 hypothetical protein [Propionicimonas sp.]